MGNAAALANIAATVSKLSFVSITAEADSLSCPGEKSCVSAPIPKSSYKDFDSFFDDIARHCKTPVQQRDITYGLIKEFQFKTLGPHDSECKVMLHGDLLQACKFQEDGMDALSVWATTHVDPEKKTIVVEMMDESGSLSKTFNTALHLDKHDETFRLEYWFVNADGSRDNRQEICDLVNHQYLRPPLFMRMLYDVQVTPLQPDPDQPDRLISMTEDLSGIFDGPEAAQEAWVAHIKQEALELNGTVEHGEDEAAEVTLTAPVEVPLGSGKEPIRFTLVSKLRSDMDKRRVEVVIGSDYGSGGEPRFSRAERYQVYTDPLRIGAWYYRPSEHNNGKEFELGHFYIAGEFAARLHHMLSLRNAGEQVESLDEGNFFF